MSPAVGALLSLPASSCSGLRVRGRCVGLPSTVPTAVGWYCSAVFSQGGSVLFTQHRDRHVLFGQLPGRAFVRQRDGDGLETAPLGRSAGARREQTERTRAANSGTRRHNRAITRAKVPAPRDLGQRPAALEPGCGAGEDTADMLRFVLDLVVGEAQWRQAGSGVDLVAEHIASLGGGRAVVAPAVGLDDQPVVRPVEVDLEAVYDPFGQGVRQAGRRGERAEENFQIRVREAEGVTIEQGAERLDAGLAGVGRGVRRAANPDRPDRACPPR